MAIILLAGIPAKLAKQAKAAVSRIPDDLRSQWDVRTFPATGSNPEISKAQVLALQQRAAELGGAHIVGFHQTGDRRPIAAAIRPYFRFRWGSSELLWSVAMNLNDFRDHVGGILQEETNWREHVLPKDKSSPLILPRNVFTRAADHDDIWEECERFDQHPEHFTRLGKKLKRFLKEHTKNIEKSQETCMVDRANLDWKDNGPYHAKTPFPRNWKYSHLLIDGFHYDVQHHKKEEFTLKDIMDVPHTIKQTKHINIDSHGFKSH